MKIILVREIGTSTAFRVRRRALAGLAISGAIGIALLATLGVRYLGSGAVESSLLAQWRARLSDQAEVVASLESRAAAENEAIGRQLAQMQARLWRMEALGARVSEVAELDKGEFTFAEVAAQGGPVADEGVALGRGELKTQLDTLAAQIRHREFELELLESLLVDDEYERLAAPRGRPVTWGWVSSPYGRRIDPISGRKAWHAGIDFAGKEGSDVIAVASGIVIFAGPKSGYGNMVEISHADGYTSAYGHSKEILVAVGDVVHKGERIATMGRTGRATGPHVHFEVRRNGKHVDPAGYVAKI